MQAPRTREQLIDETLSDEVVEMILAALVMRVRTDGDVRAAQLLLEFRYGRNPEPPDANETLADLLLKTPTTREALSSE